MPPRRGPDRGRRSIPRRRGTAATRQRSPKPTRVASEARVISPEAAWQRLAECLAALPARRVPLFDAAGRVLAEPLRATVDVPFADVSAMDGYAIGGEVE